jgi:hypothetical protein
MLGVSDSAKCHACNFSVDSICNIAVNAMVYVLIIVFLEKLISKVLAFY